MKDIAFTTQLTPKEFQRANFAALIQTTSIKIIIGVYSFFAISSIVSAFLTKSFSPLFTVAFLGLFYYFIFFLKYKRTDKKLFEKVEWNINEEFTFRKAETYEVKLTTKDFYKVSENKQWLFLWLNKSICLIISKNAIPTHILSDIKNIFTNIPSVKKKYSL